VRGQSWISVKSLAVSSYRRATVRFRHPEPAATDALGVLPIDDGLMTPEPRMHVCNGPEIHKNVEDAFGTVVPRDGKLKAPTPETLIGTTGRNNPDDAQRYGRTESHSADPVAIANLAYANRNGNGDADSGNGWAYRGRGLFQLTGRANYRAFTEWHESVFRESIDFEADPCRAADPRYAVRSARLPLAGP
jgi:hypothetical protein